MNDINNINVNPLNNNDLLDNKLPPEAFRCSIQIDKDFNTKLFLSMSCNKIVNIPLRIKNTSNIKWVVDGKYPVNLSYHFLVPNTKEMILYDGKRVHLEKDLEPGREIKIISPVNTPIEKGEYIIEFDMVQERVSWFSSAKTVSNNTLQFKIKVF